MAGLKLGLEVKVREFVLVPSYKLKALEEAGAESVYEGKQKDKEKDEEGNSNELKPSTDISAREVGEDTTEMSDNETKVPTESEQSQSNRVRNKRGGGASLDERRKRLHKLWLNL